MRRERSHIEFPLWRKKVDSSLFRKAHTPIPNWCAKIWEIAKAFGKNTLTTSPISQTKIEFNKKVYDGWVTYSFNKDTTYQLFLSKDFVECLKDVFIMSYMRSLEQRLRKDKKEYKERDIEQEVPFWEFLDIEFDVKNKLFICKAHYTQKPIFPELFRQLVRSHILKDMENQLLDKGAFKFIKENWRTKDEAKTFLERNNIIYYLLDTQKKHLYIGEGEHSGRIFQPHTEIPKWDHFRVDCLPEWLTKPQRVELERLIIRSFASILNNNKNISTKLLSDYHLVNKRIDS